MSSAERLRDLLPSLYRPELDAPVEDLLAGLVRSAGAQVDAAAVAAGDVMQAHWARYADSALLSGFVARTRRLSGQPPLKPGEPPVALHPYLDDLPRIAGLLGLSPWREPLADRETVEEFRRRIQRMVALYRDGQGTREALRRITQASLPVADRQAAPGLRERGFTIEEFAAGAPLLLPAVPRGPPTDLVGPLMRWPVQSQALLPSPPEIYIEGVASVPGKVDATAQPIVECFDPATGTGLGIGYDGTLAPGQALAILPAYTSWLGAATGTLAARHEPMEAPADPTAPGPWTAEAGGPAGSVIALILANDGALWAAVNDTGAGAFWRYDGTVWAEALGGLPALLCLARGRDGLLVGTASGLARLPLPDATPTLSAPVGPPVHALLRSPAGTWWAATETGAATFGASLALNATGPGARVETQTPLSALWADPDGTLFFGGLAGLFRHDPVSGLWHVYRGGTGDETVPDFAAWDPATDALPTDAQTFLPPVTAILRGTDRSLWLGTSKGIARYRARRVSGTYATLLDAWPELGTMAVHAMAEDERQGLWCATDRGLLHFDGLDWRQAQGGALVRLPRAEESSDIRHWRFDRASDRWQMRVLGGAAAFTPQTPAPLTTAEPAVTAIAWTDGAVARLGSFDGTRFTADATATPAGLMLRQKLVPTRIQEGGIPATPRLPAGLSQWRYLQREEATPPTPRAFPAWTREGRLLPPPNARASPAEGRFLAAAALAEQEQVFAFNPAAKVWLRWRPRAALSVTVRLAPLAPTENIAAAVLDRVQDGLERMRPAGVRVRLAVGETIVRGGEDG